MLVNLTKHNVVVYDPEGEKVRLIVPPSGDEARVETSILPVTTVDGIPVVKPYQGMVVGLPEPKSGVTYITSYIVMNKVRRDDVVSPDTTNRGRVRGVDGRVLGCKRFQTYAEMV